jgi:hypothetical protein
MDPKVTASEIMIRVLAACEWGKPADRGEHPRLHLLEAGYSLDSLLEWVRNGGFRPRASEVMELVQAYFDSVQADHERRGS